MDLKTVKRAIWICTWIFASYFLSTLWHGMVFLIGGVLRSGTSGGTEFGKFLSQAVLSSWQLNFRGGWQGNCLPIFSLLIGYGISAGLILHKQWQRAIPILILAAMIPAYLLFLPVVAPQFVLFFTVQTAVLVAGLTAIGIGVDIVLKRWFEPWVNAAQSSAKRRTRRGLGW